MGEPYYSSHFSGCNFKVCNRPIHRHVVFFGEAGNDWMEMRPAKVGNGLEMIRCSTGKAQHTDDDIRFYKSRTLDWIQDTVEWFRWFSKQKNNKD